MGGGRWVADEAGLRKGVPTAASSVAVPAAVEAVAARLCAGVRKVMGDVAAECTCAKAAADLGAGVRKRWDVDIAADANIGPVTGPPLCSPCFCSSCSGCLIACRN